MRRASSSNAGRAEICRPAPSGSAQWAREKLVLRYIAEQSFEPGVEYPERAVDERVRGWCEDSDEIDHVTLRRYLVDLHHLRRSEGIYRRTAESGRAESA
ncbi:DUF2087 domain-containing protein [Streptomyces chartreusis]|uniref:DUF2087 domain-containing protein n=1 Tax=Streptomyces chartreusis TaxID=1969 RepID=UPI003629CAE8